MYMNTTYASSVSYDSSLEILRIGDRSISVSSLPRRQADLLEKAVRDHRASVEAFHRANGELAAATTRMLHQIGQGYRWHVEFVTDCATRLAAASARIVETEQHVVAMARMAGVL